MSKLATIILLSLTVMLAACSGKREFNVSGTVEGGRTMNLRFVFVGDDNLNNVLTAARDGKFEFRGQAPDEGTLVEVLDNDYRALAYFYVRNGDKIGLDIKPGSQAASMATGNKVMDRWNEWQKKNTKVVASTDGKVRNAAVAAYVNAHPDDIVSALLMATYYDAAIDPAGANRLLGKIRPEARPSTVTSLRLIAADLRDKNGNYNRVVPVRYHSSKTDTTAIFKPRDNRRTLMAFTMGPEGRDTIVSILRELYRDKVKGVEIIDFRFDADTLTWKRDLRRDSVKWTSAWMPQATSAPGLDRLGITSLPCFIVADSTGRQLYHGPGITRAVRVARGDK